MRSLHKEDPALAKHLLEVHWEATECEFLSCYPVNSSCAPAVYRTGLSPVLLIPLVASSGFKSSGCPPVESPLCSCLPWPPSSSRWITSVTPWDALSLPQAILLGNSVHLHPPCLVFPTSLAGRLVITYPGQVHSLLPRPAILEPSPRCPQTLLPALLTQNSLPPAHLFPVSHQPCSPLTSYIYQSTSFVPCWFIIAFLTCYLFPCLPVQRPWVSAAQQPRVSAAKRPWVSAYL